MAIGAAAALLMTPAVYAIQSLAVRIWKYQHHPVEELVLGKFSFGIATAGDRFHRRPGADDRGIALPWDRPAMARQADRPST